MPTTAVEATVVRSVLNRHKRRDDWFLDDYSVNPYYGCPFGCVYCYVRGTKYGGAGRPGVVSAKVNAPEVLARQLRAEARAGRRGFIALGTATEPYMSVEAELKLTRRCLEVISAVRFPVHVLTKSDLVLRDADLLREVSKRAILPGDLRGRVEGAIVTVSISTLDPEAAKAFEPGAPPPERRFEVVKRLSEEGLRVGVAYIPVLPGISDGPKEIDRMVKVAAEVGAGHVFVGALTVPGGVRSSVEGVIRTRYPRLLSLYRELFSSGPYPPSHYQARLDKEARKACARHGVRYRLL